MREFCNVRGIFIDFLIPFKSEIKIFYEADIMMLKLIGLFKLFFCSEGLRRLYSYLILCFDFKVKHLIPQNPLNYKY